MADELAEVRRELDDEFAQFRTSLDNIRKGLDHDRNLRGG